jgi:hypothetical protein
MGGPAGFTPEGLVSLREKYGLEMDLSSIPDLIERFGLRGK